MQVIHDTLLGDIVPAQAPIATAFAADTDDWDLALYVDGPVWLMKLELDYHSRMTNKTETLEKEVAVNADFLEAKGRGPFINEFEKTFDKVAASQLTFIPHYKIVEIRRAIMDLLNEGFETIDKEENA